MLAKYHEEKDLVTILRAKLTLRLTGNGIYVIRWEPRIVDSHWCGSF